MAMLRCPDCGNAVSDNARACPNCGRSLKPKSDQEEEKRACQFLGIVGLILLAIFVFWLIRNWHSITTHGLPT